MDDGDILLKYPEIWPFIIATEDLSSSLALYRYAEYGLLLREKLEVDGPYGIPDSYFTEWREGVGIILAGSHSHFTEHKTTILSFAKNQFLFNAYSIFELFVANLTIFIWMYCSGNKVSNNLKFIWDEEKQRAFMENPEIANIEDKAWMQDNYKADTQKRRVQLLENICGLNIRNYTTDVNGLTLDWQQFKSHESLRHNIAHTAGRYTLYSEKSLKRKEITKEEVLHTFWYLHGLFEDLNKQIYKIGIFRYEH